MSTTFEGFQPGKGMLEATPRPGLGQAMSTSLHHNCPCSFSRGPGGCLDIFWSCNLVVSSHSLPVVALYSSHSLPLWSSLIFRQSSGFISAIEPHKTKCSEPLLCSGFVWPSFQNLPAPSKSHRRCSSSLLGSFYPLPLQYIPPTPNYQPF